jgi:hypothetical protein
MHTRLSIADLDDRKLLFYDIETDHQYSPYAKLRMIGVQVGLNSEPYLIETPAQEKEFRRMLADPTMLKFGWNSRSFDDIVLQRYNYPVNEINAHDLMLAVKTVHPTSPSYSLKFCNFDTFSDPHFPEMELEAWAKKTGQDKWTAPKELLGPYCLHDITQTANMFQVYWDHVILDRHWAAYCLDISQGAPLHEMMLRGGIYLDPKNLGLRINDLNGEKLYWEQKAFQLSKGKVLNPNSSKQVGLWLDQQGFDLELSDNGAFSVPKELLLDLLDLDDPSNDQDQVLRCTYEVRKVNSSLKYYENYLKALQDTTYNLQRCNWIPTSFSISSARTRRYTSSSLFGLNFQNPNKEAKKVQLVPEGWLGVWIDSTQVENVVHIYESRDMARRRAYEADVNWNEYVWLANRILSSNLSKDELDAIPSEQNPRWSVYKQFKTTKLALNFGMGIDKFCSMNGLEKRIGKMMFDQTHEACPAIHGLQERVTQRLLCNGYVQDTFGHIYSGNLRQAYKVVAYLIQGCGTGSLPKAQIRAAYDTLQEYDFGPIEAGHLCGTTHDELGLRLSLQLGKKDIFVTLQKLMYNMTEKFSPKFDNIPLRAKLYLSRTTAAEAQEISIQDKKEIERFCS